MNKRKGKKSWLEKIDELDTKQQTRLEARAKISQANAQRRLDHPSKHTYRILASLIITLPFIAWLIGALINPSGWAADTPSIILVPFIMLPMFYWFISIPILLIIISLIVKRMEYAAIILTFVISLLGSLFIFYTTVTADESEFTG
jgi:hypothetical protein